MGVKRQGPSVTTLREESTVGSLQCTAGPAALEAISCQLSALSQATISTFKTTHSTLHLLALRAISLLLSPICSVRLCVRSLILTVNVENVEYTNVLNVDSRIRGVREDRV